MATMRGPPKLEGLGWHVQRDWPAGWQSETDRHTFAFGKAKEADVEVIGKLTRVPLREVWRHEALDFTRWLEDNLDVLNEHLEIPLISADREQSTGSFSVDLLAEDETGRTVVIENQLERTDHDHLGKVITYLAAFDAQVAIWISSDPRSDHVRAVSWLNESTPAMFYLFRVEAVQIGESSPALLITPIVQPDIETKDIAVAKKEYSERHLRRRAFWQRLLDIANQRTRLHSGVSATMHPYLGTGAGMSGLSYLYWLNKNEARVGLWIDRGQGNAELNQSIFDQLLAERDAIEHDFGGAMGWHRMEDSRSCKVLAEVPSAPGWQDDLDANEAGLIALADAMDRFEKAVAPRLSRVDLSAHVEKGESTLS